MKVVEKTVSLFFCAILIACAALPPIEPSVTEPVQRPNIATIAAMDDTAAVQALGLNSTNWGYLVVDAVTGSVVAAHQPDMAFPPASIAKLPTMIAALSILGPSYRFTTQLHARGLLKSGVLQGDLVLSGDGDPLLTVGDLRALAVRLRDTGITKVDGRFLFHSAMPEFTEVETSQPATAPYNQGLGGLNLEFNRALLTRPSQGSDDGAYTTPPEAMPYIPADARMISGRYTLPVQNPAEFTAHIFKKFAAFEGVDLPSPASGSPAKDAIILAQIKSQPLIEIARAGLEYSNNMVAEIVGLAASQNQDDTTSTLAQSANTLGRWLDLEVPGLEGFKTALTNHSGLSTTSRISPRQMAALLGYAKNKHFDGWRFDTLLAPGGARDNFRGRFRSPELGYRVWAKSGTMRYIKGLAGYLNAASGKRLIFSIFVYDQAKRDQLENDPARFSSHARRQSSQWRNDVEHFEEGLIQRWITTH